MINFRLLRNSDTALWICAALLVIIGFLSIYSSTFSMLSKKSTVFDDIRPDPFMFVERHLVSFLLGLAALLLFSYLDYSHFENTWLWFYGGMLLLLGAVAVAGSQTYGAQRWIGIGFFSLQPSEIAKLVMIFAVGRFISVRGGLKTLSDLLLLGILIGVPFLLIFKQPDLGTSLVLVAITYGMALTGAPSLAVVLALIAPLLSVVFCFHPVLWAVYLIALCGLLWVLKPGLWESCSVFGAGLAAGLLLPQLWNMLKGYQKERFLSFLNPGADPFGAGYHTIQSQIAIGSGGFFGSGFLRGTQTQLQFIPQQWTDFIFSAVGEEFGLIGTMLVLLLFLTIIWRALAIALGSRDLFGSLVAVGIASMYLFHVFVNIGMTLGMAPVVGIPLPLVSFGGTSLIMNLASIGVLQSISMRRVKLFF
ncbi:MAG: rod shape-determining protein RodA [Candidatus Margulisiibacteriota bacterium]